MTGINSISAQKQVRILPFYAQQDNNPRNITGKLLNQPTANPIGTSAEKSRPSLQIKQMLRELDQTPAPYSNPYANGPANKKNGFLELSGSPDNDEDGELDNAPDYNYKEVETKIRQAKTAISAGQAVISAKRKVMEVKRKIASSNGDPEELQLALTHAKRIEIVAKRKKHHLELEELVKTTGERDERMSKQDEQNTNSENIATDPIKEDIEKAEDRIFQERQDILSNTIGSSNSTDIEPSKDISETLSDEMVSELNRMISEFGEEELKELEESMEILEYIEIVDPHMSKEDLEDLKQKHRADEQKAMLKADMDYLKDLIKHQTAPTNTSSMSGMQTSPIPASIGFVGFTGIEAPSATVSVSVDTVV